ncbi:MAG: hypothetical protein KAI66_06780, partial [Lentisphaeria bacterium]|nr:hypothetical protein [Lentisphaeria bacterium]
MKKLLHIAFAIAFSATAFGAETFYRELSSKSSGYRHHARERYIQGMDGRDNNADNASSAPLALENVQHGVKGVGTGTDGSVYVIGAHQGRVYENGDNSDTIAGSNGFGTVSYSDGYLAKMAPDGTWEWSKTLSNALSAFLSSGDDSEAPLYPRKIKVTKEAIYIAGDCDKRDDDHGNAFKRGFIAKLDINGEGQWCTFFRERDRKPDDDWREVSIKDPQVHIADIAVVREGELLFAGDYSAYMNVYSRKNGQLLFDISYWDDVSSYSNYAYIDWYSLHAGNMSWEPGETSWHHHRVLDCFAGKLRDSDGRPIWWEHWGFKEDDIATAVTGDPEGNVYVAWIVANDIEHRRHPKDIGFTNFGSQIGTEDGVALIAKFDADGNKKALTEMYRWDLDGSFTDLAFSKGYLYAIGSWRGRIHNDDADAGDYWTYDNSTGLSGYWQNDKMDATVWRLSSNLFRRDLFFFTGRSEIWADGLAVDADGDLHVVGRFSSGTMEGGSTELSTAMDWSFFRAHLDWDLNLQSLQKFDGVGIEKSYGASVAALPDGDGIVMGGAFKGKEASSKLLFGSGATQSELLFGTDTSIHKGFLTMFDAADAPYQQVDVTIASEETLQSGELEPYTGARNFIRRGDLVLDVKVPEYLYYDNGNARINSESGAVRRFHADGFSTQPHVTPQPGSPVNELSFTPSEDTTVTATWTEEFKVSVRSDDNDLADDAGDPTLNVTETWQEQGAQ